MIKQSFLKILFTAIICNIAFAQYDSHPLYAEDYKAQQQWVDSVYASLTLEERIGQLYMVQVFSSKTLEQQEEVAGLIRENKLGGLIFSNGGPVRQARLTNAFQELAKTKLLIGIDAEWGLSMRLDSTFAYPYNMMLGAIKDDEIIKRVGSQIGRHCRRIGTHINFAPSVDINTNPDNPIIGNRSFGERAPLVAQKALAFMKGMQEAGVLASAKHFPGHGDTETDSHKTLPTVGFSKERLERTELYPFSRLIEEGLSSVMVAHLQVPSLESEAGLPSSLSSAVVTDLLKAAMNFDGLVITDALQMKGAANTGTAEEVDLKAFLAGNDILLMPGDVRKGIDRMASAYREGTITEGRLSHSVKKILMAKYKAGLHRYQPVLEEGLQNDLHTVQDALVYERAVESALTMIRNEGSLLPLTELENKTIAYVPMGEGDGSVFNQYLSRYTSVTEVKDAPLSDLLQNLQPYNTVILGFHPDTSTPWKDKGPTEDEIHSILEIARNHKVILAYFGKPYGLRTLRTLTNIESVLIGYQNQPLIQQKMAELLFGSIPSKGSLPVRIGETYKAGDALESRTLSRLGFSTPEAVGMDARYLKKIDSVMQRAVRTGVTPGGQVLVARRGKVVYHRNFGRHTYSRGDVVADTNLYDLASLTKILASLPLLMKLADQGKFRLTSTLGEMIPEVRRSNKANLPLLRVLSHYAGFKPWIPFYTQTLNEVTKNPSEIYYKTSPDKTFSIQVADELYLRKDYPDSIRQQIIDTELLSKETYRYSDLPFYLLQSYIEREYDLPLDEAAQKEFYEPLGMNYTTFNPLQKFGKAQIVPSEIDDYYRDQTVQGYVHDMGAAMMGGVAGHAGLFSNAMDVAKIMQMFLQKGYYGGKRFFREETFEAFNTCYFCEENVRRGVGFDKPQLGDTGPTCGCVSTTSFGHSGFTGTYAWADPEFEIVYVFMANRTYPESENRKIITEGTRTVIQEIIYDAIRY